MEDPKLDPEISTVVKSVGTNNIVSNEQFNTYNISAGEAAERAENSRIEIIQTIMAQNSEDNLESTEERKRSLRDSDKITEDMIDDIIELLNVFGLPYMTAPSEAEAQCAALEQLGLVDGVVTEDSDTFLFGGTSVYRNMFQDNKIVEVTMDSL